MDDGDPSYYELLSKSTAEIYSYWKNLEYASFSFDQMYSTVVDNWHFRLGDLVLPFCFAFGIYGFRKLLELIIYPLCQSFNFAESDRKKLPESVFLVITYGVFWVWECIIVFKYNFFLSPSACFKNWSEAKLSPAPENVNLLYVAVLGFYIQALVYCILIEDRRKDTNVMILHHVATIFLVSFSLGMRFWQIGCLVLFCHDICDVFLDLSKIFVYVQNRPAASKTTKIICEVAKTVGFICFVLSWVLFRFHYYPKKALYSVMYHSRRLINGGPPCWLFYSFLLGSIQVMHIYWFYFIVKLLVKIAIGSGELRDTREENKKSN